MTVTVFHINRAGLLNMADEFGYRVCSKSFADLIGFVTSDCWSPVADIDVDSLEKAWMLSNHIEENWCEGALVTMRDAAQITETRSSMVGDIFVMGGKAFMVAGMGFKELPHSTVVARMLNVDMRNVLRAELIASGQIPEGI